MYSYPESGVLYAKTRGASMWLRMAPKTTYASWEEWSASRRSAGSWAKESHTNRQSSNFVCFTNKSIQQQTKRIGDLHCCGPAMSSLGLDLGVGNIPSNAAAVFGSIAMNGDEISEGQYAVSTSNRNFEGRQGRGGRTLLASPLTAAACAVTGAVADPRTVSEDKR